MGRRKTNTRAAFATRVPGSATGFPARQRLPLAVNSAEMKFEDWPEEWREWAMLTPMERFRESEKIFAQYLAMGGSLDPDPDPTSPFYDPDQWSPGAAHGRAGLRVLRRGAS